MKPKKSTKKVIEQEAKSLLISIAEVFRDSMLGHGLTPRAKPDYPKSYGKDGIKDLEAERRGWNDCVGAFVKFTDDFMENVKRLKL